MPSVLFSTHGTRSVPATLATAQPQPNHPTTTTSHGIATVQRLIERRRQLLGPAYRLFYDRPLHIVRGEGVWLYDADGKPYLDAYNNVPHVGHCHPTVVDALVRQAKTLNTHTRYLHEAVLDYAGRLTSKFPGDLSVVMFACTGSEANELAVRIAKSASGGDGFIVTEHAYHGNTNAISELSTTHAYVQRGPEIKTVPAPNAYRGPYRSAASDDDVDIGSRYADHVHRAVDAMRREDIKPAAMLVDTIFSTDGIHRALPGYLQATAEEVRAAGGVLIADEVQAGFGRTGDHLWGFEHHAVIPDIVTLGKPMGNGHPIAAVVTTPQLAAKFAESAHYFNTFGGNPVACAAASAVLDVLEGENLQENARSIGAYLRDRIDELRSSHDLIGDVRGSGLYIGVELVRDHDTLEPASAETAAVVNGLRDRGVLISSTGKENNVLKIRPPLVFSRQHADQLVTALDTTLRAI